MDLAQFLNVLSGKKCARKNPAQIQDCICAIFRGFERKKVRTVFLEKSAMKCNGNGNHSIFDNHRNWLLASVKIKVKHQSLGK